MQQAFDKAGRLAKGHTEKHLYREANLDRGIAELRLTPALARRGLCRGFLLRSLGDMLRFVVSASAANMMLVRCNSDVPIA